MPAQQLSKAQQEDATRLRAAFKRLQQARRAAKEPASQEALSEELGFGQSAVSQYLNGKIPLNPDALAKFSQLLGVSPADISPDIAIAQAKRSATWLVNPPPLAQVPGPPTGSAASKRTAPAQPAKSPVARNLAAMVAHEGLKPATWAGKHKVPPTLVAMIIDGNADPTVSEVQFIAQRLGLEAWQLLVPELQATNPPLLQSDGEAIKALLKNIHSTKEAIDGYLREGGNTGVGDLDDRCN